MNFLFVQFVIDPLVLLVLLVLRHWHMVEFTIMEARDI